MNNDGMQLENTLSTYTYNDAHLLCPFFYLILSSYVVSASFVHLVLADSSRFQILQFLFFELQYCPPCSLFLL